MTMPTRRSFALLAGTALLGATAAPFALAQAQAQAQSITLQSTTPGAKNRALFQVTDNDPARWTMILNNMKNLREGVGSEGVDIELVAFGPGVNMLKSDSAMKDRIADAMKAGVKVNACQNTMHGMQLTPADMLPAIGYVPSGVVEVMRKQQQGWAYIRA